MKNVFQRDVLLLFKDVLSCFKAAEEAGGKSYVQSALTYLLSTGERVLSASALDDIFVEVV